MNDIGQPLINDIVHFQDTLYSKVMISRQTVTPISSFKSMNPDEVEILAIALVDVSGAVKTISVYKAPIDNIAMVINYILIKDSV